MNDKYTAQDAERIIKAEGDLNNLKPQGLREVKHSYTGLKHQPEEIKQESPAGVLFYNLQLCYQHQKNVSEGCISDILYGFKQSGIPGSIVMDGFSELYRLRYLDFTDPQGIQLLGTFNEKAWFKWTQKYFDLLLDSKDTAELLIADSIKPKDKTVDDLTDK